MAVRCVLLLLGARRAAAPQCSDDPAWLLNNSISCANFVVSPGTADCEQSWATGAGADGGIRVAYEACEVSCPRTSTPRSCWDVAPPSCGDTDGDGVADLFDCSGGISAAADVVCAARPAPSASAARPASTPVSHLSASHPHMCRGLGADGVSACSAEWSQEIQQIMQSTEEALALWDTAPAPPLGPDLLCEH